jgi:hypothetical protein
VKFVAGNQSPETSNQKKSLREKIRPRILRHDHRWHFSCPRRGRVITRYFSQLEKLGGTTPKDD